MPVIAAPFLPLAGGAVATGVSTALKVAGGTAAVGLVLKAMQDARDVHWRNLGFPIPEIDIPTLPNPLELPETGILPFPTPGMGPVFDPRAGQPTIPDGRTPSSVYDFRPPAPLPGQTLPKTRRLTDAEIFNDLIRQATTVNTGFNPLFPIPQFPLGFPFSFDPNEINNDWDWGGLNPISPDSLWRRLFGDRPTTRLRSWGYMDISTPGSYLVRLRYIWNYSFIHAGVSCSDCSCYDTTEIDTSTREEIQSKTISEGIVKFYSFDAQGTTQCEGCRPSCSPTPMGFAPNESAVRQAVIWEKPNGDEVELFPRRDFSGDTYWDLVDIGTEYEFSSGIQIEVSGKPMILFTGEEANTPVPPAVNAPPIEEVQQWAPAQLLGIPPMFRDAWRNATEIKPVIQTNTRTGTTTTTLETESEPEKIKPVFPKIAPPAPSPRPLPQPQPDPKETPAVPLTVPMPQPTPLIAPKPKEGQSDDAKEITPDGPIVKNPPKTPVATTPASSLVKDGKTYPAKAPNINDTINELGRQESKQEAIMDNTKGPKWDDILLALEGLAFLLDQLLGEKMPAQAYQLIANCEETDEEGNQPSITIDIEEKDKMDGIAEAFSAMNQLIQQSLEWKHKSCDEKVETPKPEGQLVTTRWKSFEPSPISGDRLRKLFRFRLKTPKSLEQVTAYWKDFTWESGAYLVKANGPWGQQQVWAKDEAEGRRVIMRSLKYGGWVEKEEEVAWQLDEVKNNRYGLEATFGIDGSINRPWITMREGPSGPPEGVEY